MLHLQQQLVRKPKKKIIKVLEMEEAVIVNQNPNRKNIAYSFQTASGGANNTFAPFIEESRKNGTSSERVIIYCQTIKVVYEEQYGGDVPCVYPARQAIISPFVVRSRNCEEGLAT